MSEVACCRLLPLSGFAAKPRPPDAVVLTHSYPVDQTRSLPHASRPHLPRRRRLAATPASRSGCRPRGARSVRTCGRTNASAASHVRCAPTTRDHLAIMPSGVLQKCTSLRREEQLDDCPLQRRPTGADYNAANQAWFGKFGNTTIRRSGTLNHAAFKRRRCSRWSRVRRPVTLTRLIPRPPEHTKDSVPHPLHTDARDHVNLVVRKDHRADHGSLGIIMCARQPDASQPP
jgi:hypothetical protein